MNSLISSMDMGESATPSSSIFGALNVVKLYSFLIYPLRTHFAANNSSVFPVCVPAVAVENI